MRFIMVYKLNIPYFSDPCCSCRCTLRSRPLRQLRWTKRCLSHPSPGADESIKNRIQLKLYNQEWKFPLEICVFFAFFVMFLRMPLGYPRYRSPNHEQFMNALRSSHFVSSQDTHLCDAVLRSSPDFAGACHAVPCWLHLLDVSWDNNMANMGLIGRFKSWSLEMR